jgi:hypothetical protein
LNDSISRLQRFLNLTLTLTWGVAPGCYISRRWRLVRRLLQSSRLTFIYRRKERCEKLLQKLISHFLSSRRKREIFPGVHERRYFLRGSLATVAALFALRATPKSLLAQTPIKSTGAAGVDGLAWDDFLKQSVPIAQQLIADPAFSVDEYLYRIGSLATRLKEIPDSALGSYKTVEPRVWFGPSFRGSPFSLFSGAWNRALSFLRTTIRTPASARLGMKEK